MLDLRARIHSSMYRSIEVEDWPEADEPSDADRWVSHADLRLPTPGITLFAQ